jgi:predicted Zn-dependent protease
MLPAGTCGDEATYGGSDPDRWCRPQDIQLNTHYSPSASAKKSIACHELGHTLGLRHSVQVGVSCMRDGEWTQQGYSPHDSTMLAGQY